nr:MAG TPA: hypothetical protein [Caudoviricetes sp.]
MTYYKSIKNKIYPSLLFSISFLRLASEVSRT